MGVCWDDEDDDSFEAREAVMQAINEIRRGAYADAITTLEREFLPYYEDVDACEAAYRKTMLLLPA